jgi:fatty-acyl-CoA synthase
MTPTNLYELGLDKDKANFVALSPLSFVERSANVYPDRTAAIYGSRRQTWRDTYARSRRLATRGQPFPTHL